MRLYLYFLIAAGLSACTPSAPIQSAKTCPTINGVGPLLADDGPDIIVIGEIHGQEQPPALVTALVCHSLNRGQKTVLALEMSDDDGQIASYLKSDGSSDAQAKLFQHWMWKGEFTDGRSSMAMLNLIDSARGFTQSHPEFEVVTFQAGDIKQEDYETRNARNQAYEKAMADNIISGAARVGADKTIALVGNLHARRGKNTRGDSDYEFMASHMPSPKTLTLNTVYTDGMSWNCQGREPTDCGPYKTRGVVDPESDLGKSDTYTVIPGSDEAAIAPFVGHQYKPEFYDGVIYVGQVTASPPANKEGRVPFEVDEKK